MQFVKKSIFLCALFLIGLSSCDTEETGSLELNFKLKYDNQTLVMFDEQAYPAGFDVFFTRFSFFMSDIKLSGINEHVVSEIVMVNPTASHQELNSAQNGYSINFNEIPVGDYSGLDFGIGVPSDLNAMAPADFSTDHPLSSSGEYWLGWESYVFIKIEGKMDMDGNGEFEEGMSLHVGSDAVFRQAEMVKPVSIIKDEKTTVEIVIDLNQVFLSNGALYDLEGTPRIHSLEQINQAEQLATNLAKVFEE